MVSELPPRILPPLKVFDQTFNKKFVGVLGVKPLTSSPLGVWGEAPTFPLLVYFLLFLRRAFLAAWRIFLSLLGSIILGAFGARGCVGMWG